jgi:threonine/homoserine/homoserine lactone efflux protein
MWHDRGALRFDSASAERGAPRIILRAILINILNPKLTIFFFAFLPLFISPGAAAPLGELVVLSGVFMAITLAVFIAYGALASSVRTYIFSSPRILAGLRRSFAAAFAAMAVRLAVADR